MENKDFFTKANTTFRAGRRYFFITLIPIAFLIIGTITKDVELSLYAVFFISVFLMFSLKSALCLLSDILKYLKKDVTNLDE